MIYYITKQTRISNSFVRSSIADIYEYFKNKSEIAFDSETEGFDPHEHNLISIQIGDYENQFVIDCTTIDIAPLKQLLESKLVVMHNAQFDLRFLYSNSIFVENVYDTFLAECILTTGYPQSSRELGLGKVSEKYTGVSLNKSIRSKIHIVGLTDDVIEYGAKDVKYLLEIKRKQLDIINKYNLTTVLNLENEVVKVFAEMSYKGINFDKNNWINVYKITEHNTKELIDKLDNIVFSDPKLKKFIPSGFQQNLFGEIERKLIINWSSPAQKLEILQTLGLDVQSVGDRDLQRNKNKHPIISTLIEYSKQSKLATAFGKDFLKFINKKTGRIHSSFWQILNTGRISVSEPNLNQIPSKGDLAKTMRKSFIPSKGYKIVGGDYSSFELAIIAELSKDPLWVKTLIEGKNLHSVLAAATFDIPIENVENSFPFKPILTYRDVQKTIDFGLAYGMSEFKLADTMGVPVEQAKQIIDKFFGVVPKVKDFLESLAKLGVKRGYIKTAQPFGRIRWFPEYQFLKDNPTHPDKFKIIGSIERRSKNTPIQGTNGDIIKLALVNVRKEIIKNNWPVNILLSIYDEIQTECREDKAEEWKIVLENIMIDAAKTVLKTVPIKVDCKIADYWTK